jgi:LuxR family transcriptional regulator, maltose regulon positive regulatory protein
VNAGARHPHQGDALTPAEERVAECLAEGMTTREICAVVGRSQATVETHISRIRAKVGATNNRRLVSMLARRYCNGR